MSHKLNCEGCGREVDSLFLNYIDKKQWCVNCVTPKSKLSQIKKELKEKIKKKVLFPLCSYKSYFDFIKNCGDLIDETDDLITQIINKGR